MDLTPLIDVVFQLLIFFMLSSTFVIQTSIQIEMPKAPGATKLENKDLSITLTAGQGGPDGLGQIFVTHENEQTEIQSWPDLSQTLIRALDKQPDLIALIRADTHNEVGRFLHVMGIARSVGIARVGVAAEPPAEKE